jgi:UDP-glucose 4-epimerase
MQGQPMTVFGDGSQTRAFSYIDDVAPHIANCVNVPEAYGEVINIGADKPYTIKYLGEVTAQAFGVEPQFQYLPARNEVAHAYSDHSKAKRLFGRQLTVSLDDGVARMAEWAQHVGARESQRFENIEVQRNLPPSWQA